MQPNSIASATRAALVAAALVCLGLCAAISAALSPAQTKDAVKVKAKAETYYYLVFSNPVAGKEDEYNKWYDTQHAQDVVAVPGFVTAQRFVASETPLRTTTPPAKYLVIYKIVTDNLPSVFDTFRQRSPKMATSPAFGENVGYTYKTWGPLIEGDQVRADRVRTGNR